MVAQSNSFFNALDTNSFFVQTWDRQCACNRTGGQHNVVVVQFKCFVTFRLNNRVLLGVVDGAHVTGDNFCTLEVATQWHHRVARFD